MIVVKAPAGSEDGLWSNGPGETQPGREVCFVGELVVVVPPNAKTQTQILGNLPIILGECAVVGVPRPYDVHR